MKKNKTMIFLFILPTVLCLLFMYVYPVVRTVIMSFFKVESLTASTSTWSFYGLQNYFKVLRNAGFISSMKKHGDDLAGRRHHYHVPVHVDGRDF